MIERAAPKHVPVFQDATLAHVPGMGDLINRYASRGLMLPKSPQDLFRTFDNFVVGVDAGGSVVACGGLRSYSPELMEVVGLAVDEAWQGMGLGSTLLRGLVGRAAAGGADRVFALTLSPMLFKREGFEVVDRGSLHEKERFDCRSCPRRNGCREIAVERHLRLDGWVSGSLLWPETARSGLDAHTPNVYKYTPRLDGDDSGRSNGGDFGTGGRTSGHTAP